MENGDWERFGEEIRRSVQDAVDSWDFTRLNQTITNTIDAAMHGGQRTSRGVDPVGFDQDLGYKYNETKEAGRTGRENHGSSYTHTDGDTHRDAYGEPEWNCTGRPQEQRLVELRWRSPAVASELYFSECH